jgi:hypothetical protein
MFKDIEQRIPHNIQLFSGEVAAFKINTSGATAYASQQNFAPNYKPPQLYGPYSFVARTPHEYHKMT